VKMLGDTLHPLAQAVLRYYLEEGPAKTELSADEFLDELFTMGDRLPAPRLLEALDDVLIVARFLRAEGFLAGATSVARRVRTSALRGSVRAVGSGALSDAAERAGAQLAVLEGRRQAPNAPTSEAATHAAPARRGPRLEEKWAEMSDAQREKLARLAALLEIPKA